MIKMLSIEFPAFPSFIANSAEQTDLLSCFWLMSYGFKANKGRKKSQSNDRYQRMGELDLPEEV